MDADNSEIEKLVEHLIKQELEGLNRKPKEQECIATTQDAGEKQNEDDSRQG